MVNEEVAEQIILAKGTVFGQQSELIQHVASNIASFWLDYSNKAITTGRPFIFFTDCCNNLAYIELKRNLYEETKVRGDVGKIYKEIQRLGLEEIEMQFAEGRYAVIRDKTLALNEQRELAKVQIEFAFRKQS